MEGRYEVKIRVNEYLSVTMNVPKEMDASEFYSLLNMTKQLSNMKMADSYDKVQDPAYSKSQNSMPWSKEEDELVMAGLNSKENSKVENARILAETIGRTPGAIQARYYDKLKAKVEAKKK